MFQFPVGIFARHARRDHHVAQLRAYRRYAIVGDRGARDGPPGYRPGLDAVEFAILYALYELSLVMAASRRGASARQAAVDADGGEDDYPG